VTGYDVFYDTDGTTVAENFQYLFATPSGGNLGDVTYANGRFTITNAGTYQITLHLDTNANISVNFDSYQGGLHIVQNYSVDATNFETEILYVASAGEQITFLNIGATATPVPWDTYVAFERLE
jgi:hypothetical protein